MDINKTNVKVEEFKADYANIIIEKENDLANKMVELDSRIAQEIETIRETIKEKVICAIKAENDENFNSKISFYEKYLVEIVEPIVENDVEAEATVGTVSDIISAVVE